MENDELQSLLKHMQNTNGQCLDVGVKACGCADPVSDIVIRQIVERLQSAHSLIIQLQSARNANYVASV